MSDVNLTLQDNGGVYLAITETPAVVTLGQAVISGALASSVTVTNVVSVNVVTMPAISVTPAAVTTVAGTVSISNFPASSSVTIANFPSVTTVTGTVALDSGSLIALENITVTVGSTVSISNLPATQTIAGTVTANVPNLLTQDQEGKAFYGVAIGYNNENDDIFHNVSEASPLPVAGTVTANVFKNVFIKVYPTGNDWNGGILERVSQTRWQDHAGSSIEYNEQNAQWEARYADGNRLYAANTDAQFAIPPLTGWGVIVGDNFTISYEKYATQTIAGTVTVGSLPAISGTVTASVTNSVTVGSLPVQLSTTTIGGTSRLNVTLSSATTVGATAPSYGNLSGGSDGTNFRAILTDTSGRTVVTGSVGISGTVPVSGTFYQATQPVSLASLPSLAAGTAQIGSVTASISGTVPVSGTFWQATQPVSGTVTAAIASTTVTVSGMPSGTLTTRFGTPTTANTAFLTSAVTNTARKYLLIQNVTTASNVITVGVGFVPTTTQGIQLAAGAGITFESSYIPTGAVWVLSSVTASNHTILEA